MSPDTANTARGAHSAAEVADELSAWAVGAGIVTMALFPFALPILVLTGVALLPFLLVPLGAGLAVAAVAVPALLVRGLVRRIGAALQSSRGAEHRPSPAHRSA